MFRKQFKSSKKHRTKRNILKKKALNYLKITIGRKPENNRTKIKKDYMNGSLGSISDIAISTTKNTNSLIKAKTLKNSFLTNYQTIYLISLEINCNNNLLF